VIGQIVWDQFVVSLLSSFSFKNISDYRNPLLFLQEEKGELLVYIGRILLLKFYPILPFLVVKIVSKSHMRTLSAL
jgi:hypothetical protein